METSFGSWVRRRRKALDLTQDELARRVGCSSSLIFKIETDERRPSRQIAELLADQLEIPAGQRETFIKVARQELAAVRVEARDSLPPYAPPRPRDAQQGTQAGPPPPSGLPVFPTGFVGRQHEIDIIARHLLDPACRLLTLTGPGGVGKTRLAVEVAGRLEPAFPDGIYFLAMAGVSLPESILPELASAFGLTFSGPVDPKQQLIQALHTRRALLVIDNMEQLVSGSAVLGEILQGAQGPKLLLTSREPVHLQWEWLFEVQGLPVPASVRPGELESHSAPALFLQRTRQTASQAAGFGGPGDQQAAPPGADGQDTAAILQICKLVDGLPLAIELAASWARVMSPAEIAEELAHGLDLLETNLQDVPARHRSIRLVFDHSWKLLTAEERAALMKLAVFAGGFTRAAASGAAGVSVGLLSALVGKSLLRYDKQAGRYDFHELVRQYALSRLAEFPDQEDLAWTRFAEYMAGWLAGLEAQIKSEQQLAASARVRAETANWSAAWHWSARRRRLDLLRRMEPCLYWYQEVHGDYAEAVASIGYAVDELRAAGAPAGLAGPAEMGTFALLVDQLGWFEFRTGNVERAAALFAESLEAASAAPEPDQEALYYIKVNWGYMALVTGDLETSERMTRASLEHARAIGGQWHAAIAINILGIIESQRGNLAEAHRQLTGSLRIWREVGDPRGLVFCMLYLGATLIGLGDYETAESVLQESSAIAQNKHDHWAHAFALDLLGSVAAARGQPQAAAGYFRRSLELSQEIGDQLAAAQTLIHLGGAQLAAGDPEEAQRLFHQAYETACRAGWTALVLDALAAALAAGGAVPAETRLAAALAVLTHPSAAQPTRQRMEQLRAALEAALSPEQQEAARRRAGEKPAEEWAGLYFSHPAAAPSAYR